MPSLLKKKSESAADVMPPWHPNFRNFDRLPDMKVVRTAFFINGVAILLAVVMLGWFVYQQYRINDLQHQIGDWDAQITRDRTGSEQAVALYKKFQAEAARFAEIDRFIKSQPVPSELLRHIAKTLPQNFALDNFELNEKGLRLMGSISGTPDQASGYASAYVEQLRNDKVLKQYFLDPSLLNLNRQAQTDRLVAEFFLAGKDAQKKK